MVAIVFDRQRTVPKSFERGLGMVALDKGPIYETNRTKPWFREFTVFAFKQRIYAKLNKLK